MREERACILETTAPDINQYAVMLAQEAATTATQATKMLASTEAHVAALLLAEVASARRVDEAAHRTPASAVDEAAALHSAPAFVSELPDDVLRVIWAIRWRADAAAKIQRAVRRAIRRAGGDPWDLPTLVAGTDYSNTRASWYLMNYCAKMPLNTSFRSGLLSLKVMLYDDVSV